MTSVIDVAEILVENPDGVPNYQLSKEDKEILEGYRKIGLVEHYFHPTKLECWRLTPLGQAKLSGNRTPGTIPSPQAAQVVDALAKKPNHLANEVFWLLAETIFGPSKKAAFWDIVVRDFKTNAPVVPEPLGEVRTRPQVVSLPLGKQVTCRDCGAVIEYLPEHVERHDGHDYSGGSDGYERVKCPRSGCPGYGYIRTW